MSATAYEISSRRSNVSLLTEQEDRAFEVRNATNRAEAELTMLLKAPTSITGTKGALRVTTYSTEETPPGSNRYKGNVQYNLPDWSGGKLTGESVFSFDTTGGTQHISYSKSTVGKYSASGSNNIPDLKGAINATTDDVGGCDITIPAFGFTGTIYLAASNVTGTYLGNLYGLTGKVCDANYAPTIDGITLPFLKDEVLYLGATGSKRGVGDVEVSHHFAASPNVTNLTVGGITGIAKKGWEYLWARTLGQEATAGTNTILAKLPFYIYVEQVYGEGTFTGGSGLGL